MRPRLAVGEALRSALACGAGRTSGGGHDDWNFSERRGGVYRGSSYAGAFHFALDEKNDDIAGLILTFVAKHSL